MKYAFYKVINVSSLERKLFFEAYFISFFVRLVLIFFPFRKYVNKLGQKDKDSINPHNINEEFILEISHAIKRAVKYSLLRNRCLEQSITAKKMLIKRNIISTLYFGVRKNNEKLEAHAWLKVGDKFITGEKNHETFTIVAYYT